ncbi:uncharacterized protein SPAPADRAFT_61018 [Spathaspora passalidarum NRRL Y-27907]|uniref:F-box domain-containing protein n=1 Tax=Spathaspora passalidarum (strain NRRL Y-27907 / 11-Y1) TaxID=619300 RepID=G3AN72_SPAPN|nr:uncharacterized protein SPAPADRAFT_61018 [Spathaspora passalidarum NRRL Y-27907]EGW31915.1 hypothetical protein SPAPADRAFT_61018 [Spathaspora passalidarum NRRL Y-27907]
MALMLVNKQLYNLTVASLYCSIYLNFGHRAEILIDREICSDFHCGNTILNSNDSFRKLVEQRKELVDNIKSIYIFNSELKLKFWMDSETLLGMREIDLLTHIAIPSFIHVPLEDNYTVKELSLDISPVCIDEIDWATIPYLKGLETLKIKTVRAQEEFLTMTSNFHQPLKVKRLSLEFTLPKELTFETLAKVVKLDEVTSLELESPTWELNGKPFEWLFSSLTNLKHLSMVLKNSELVYELLGLVQSGTLKSLAIAPVDILPVKLQKIIEKHEQTLERVMFASHVYYTFSLDDFQRITPPRFKENLLTYQARVEQMLNSDVSKFPHLHHIVISSIQYEVTRSEGKFEVTAFNDFNSFVLKSAPVVW